MVSRKTSICTDAWQIKKKPIIADEEKNMLRVKSVINAA
jgi:hypothetical protein